MKRMIITSMIFICFFLGNVYADESSLVVEELFQAHKSIMLIMDAETGDIEYANQAAVDFYGYSKEVLLNMTMWIEVFIIAVLILVVRSRKKIIGQLEKSEKKYRTLFETMREGFALHEIICDEEGKPIDYRFIDVNPAFETITRLKRKNVVNKTVLEILPQTEDYWIEKYGKVALTGEILLYENYSKELRKHFSVYAYSPEKNQFAVMITDVTSIERARKKLYEEKERLRITLYSIGDGVITTDEKGYIIDLNKRAEEITGWTQEQAKGKLLTKVLKMINENTGKIVKNPVKTALNTGETVNLEDDVLLIARDGTKKVIADGAAPIKDENNQIIGGVIVFRDVSEKKKADEKIKYMNYHDALTGLYNRRFFEEQLKKLDKEEKLPLSIVVGDVNGLKLANDAFGHSVGDHILQETGHILKQSCRTSDIVARWGGDEFVVLLPNTRRSEAENVVNRIKEKISKTKVGSMLLSISLGYETKEKLDEEIIEVLNRAEKYMYKHKLFESPNIKNKIIQTIISTLHENNQREEEHSKRVSEISVEIGKAMKLPPIEIKKLEMAGLLHDIGKIGIRENALNKPGKLTEEEWCEIKRHPEVGYRILSSYNEMSELAECVLTHHERWDGNGYPKGLKKEDIPLHARIIMVADAYDAMVCKRPYREPLSKEETIEEIKKNAGIQFDPQIVKIFIEKVISKK
ncbi:MAG: diguanylate cyclase [Marinisporobacter sp.]|jgi:diguanylate cyclase (GGDEF)-like protein/PAS domain S-box-containing protein/putative nucleotidyltransferase with HDIG domain|nr:diguanylate cyclase [Marinisporobacter sp.]